MQQKVLAWKSTGGKSLFASMWIPQTPVKAVICLIHGFGEHCLRYEPYIQLFDNAGFAFVAYDQMGHGQSEGKRGVITSYKHLLGDVQLCVNKAEENFPHVPVFIYGHSMGGNIVFNFMLLQKPEVSGAIITSPWLMLSTSPGFFTQAAVSLLKSIIPNLTVNSGLELNYISSVNEEVEKYKNDPLNHGRISFRLFNSITHHGISAIVNANRITRPVLLMHGSADKITSNKASELASKRNEDLIQYIEWPNCYHELHNETIRLDLSNTVIDWVNTKLNTNNGI